jgi:hypothetical protein
VQVKGLPPAPAGGPTYIQVARFSTISDLPYKEFVPWKTIDKGEGAAIPVSTFMPAGNDPGLSRLCFKNTTTLAAADEKLRAIYAVSEYFLG